MNRHKKAGGQPGSSEASILKNVKQRNITTKSRKTGKSSNPNRIPVIYKRDRFRRFDYLRKPTRKCWYNYGVEDSAISPNWLRRVA